MKHEFSFHNRCGYCGVRREDFEDNLVPLNCAALETKGPADAVIEECAKIADDIAEGAATPNGQSRARAIATRIRALSQAPATDGPGK